MANVHLTEASLETLGQLLDGQVLALFQKLMQQAITDCENRPSDDKARQIKVILNLKPKSRTEQIDDRHSRTILDGIALTVDMDVKCPTRKTMAIDCGVGPGHSLLFNPHNAFNHRQAPLPLVMEGDATVRMPA